MRSNHQLKSAVRELIAEHYGLPLSEVHDNASLTDDLGSDSMGVVEVFSAIESRFHLRIQNEIADQLTTVGKIITYVIIHIPK